MFKFASVRHGNEGTIIDEKTMDHNSKFLFGSFMKTFQDYCTCHPIEVYINLSTVLLETKKKQQKKSDQNMQPQHISKRF